MASDTRVSIKISADQASRLDARKTDEETRTGFAMKMIEQGLDGATAIDLDNIEKQPFFKHLAGGKGKDYQDGLMSLELTEQELIDMAIAKTGKRYEELMKDALITHCKEQITQSARREHIDKTTEGSPEKRLQTVFAELSDMMMDGRYTPRGGRLKISAVAQRAGVNYGTARKWAEGYQPELLE